MPSGKGAEFHHTVVITTKNRPDSLLTTLRSIERHVASHSRNDLDVIVVNDSAPEHIPSYGYLERYPTGGLNIKHVTSEQAARELVKAGLGELGKRVWDTDYGFGRNLGLYLALQGGQEKNISPDSHLVTFLDDDIRLARATVDTLGRPVYHSLERDFFDNLERVFSDVKVGLSGHGYSFDGFPYAIDSVHMGVQIVKDLLEHYVISREESLERIRKILGERGSDENCERVLDWQYGLSGRLPTILSDARNGRNRVLSPSREPPPDTKLVEYGVCGGNMTVRASAAMRIPPFIRGPARTEDLLYELLAKRRGFSVVHHGIDVAHVSQKGHGNFSESQVNEHVGIAVRLAYGLGDHHRAFWTKLLTRQKAREIKAWGNIIRSYLSVAEKRVSGSVRQEVENELRVIELQLSEVTRGLRPTHVAYGVVQPMVERHRQETDLWLAYWKSRLSARPKSRL